jgi:hypothetical protein
MNKAACFILLAGVAMIFSGCVVAPYEYGTAGYYDYGYQSFPYSYSHPYYYRAPYVEVAPAWPVYYGPSVYRHYNGGGYRHHYYHPRGRRW